ncbi:Hypothetical protein I596_806 [Dokdonella koreensis DS-123]|uniref:DUF7933 domain-containing protein n=1 Tax=Dokdonella koreensis DS-123 TaxID=1300342 RepID=A0A167GNI1_9GAMM|nr:Hypothetical protein I596_806 [Dokdonella koreensis DS-123]
MLLALATPAVLAATLPVTSCADDGGSGTLRNVVAAASEGDTVDLTGLACPSITLTGGQIAVARNALTIIGPGRDALAIDGNALGRIFFHSGNGTLALTGLTLTNGRADAAVDIAAGGCAASAGGALALTDSTVTACIASSKAGSGGVAGGGLYARNGITALRSTISNNVATGVVPGGAAVNVAGGGLATGLSGTITLTDSIISGNRAETGGATALTQVSGGGVVTRNLTATNSIITNNFAGCDTASTACIAAAGGGVSVSTYGAQMTLTGCTIAHNTIQASGQALGGGIYVAANGSNRTVSHSQIDGNTAFSEAGQAAGGGIHNFGGLWTLSASSVSGNAADIGGGVFADYNALTITNSTISDNTAGNAGALFQGNRSGYYMQTMPLRVSNSTITANVATAATATGGVGGGIVDTQAVGASQFQSTLIAGNQAPNANPVRADLIAFRGEITGANNLIVNAAGTTLPAGTLSADPLLGPLQDNGGLSRTRALLPGSPAIDAGNNGQNLATDQRGPGFSRVTGPAADIGAFEYRLFLAPTLGLAFAPDAILGGETSTLTITLTNANDVAARLTTDLVGALPAPVVIAEPAEATTSCTGGSLTATPGAGNFALAAGATVPAEGFCTVSIAVTVNASGVFTQTLNAGALQTTVGATTDPASATLTVTAPNLPPVAADDAYTVVLDSVLKVAAPGVLANDTDPNADLLTAALVAGPNHGTLWLDAAGGFVYRPDPGFLGTDGFTYAAGDGQATTPAMVTFTVVRPPNDALFDDGFDAP